MSSIKNSRSLIIKSISSILSSICKENTKDSDKNSNAIKPFLCNQFALVSIKSFITFFTEETKIESSTLITMMILIDRLCAKNHFCLTYYNVYKIIIATLVLSVKVIYDDDESKHCLYTRIKGISKRDINYLEYECLTLLDFSVYISEQEYSRYSDHLTKVIRCVNKKRINKVCM